MIRAICLTVLSLSLSQGFANDDVLAHQLLKNQRHAEAAELFSDPFWRGVALYRSEQWIRAAEAFAMSGHPHARYNLGNCYARLGHYALALDAYTQFTQRAPHFEDAKSNADLMRRMMENEEKSGSAKAQPSSTEQQEQTPAPEDSQGSGEAEATEEQDNQDSPQQEQEDGSQGELPDTDENGQPPAESREGETTEKVDGGQSATEEEGSPEPQKAPVSSGKNHDGDDHTQQNFMSSEQQKQQASEQWLSTIVDHPARFLKARIDLEMRRRSDAGTLPPKANPPW